MPSVRSDYKPVMPEKYTGDKGPVQLESWLFAMELYLHTAQVPEGQRALMAATNLAGHAQLWFQANAIGYDLSQLTWANLAQGLRDAFMP